MRVRSLSRSISYSQLAFAALLAMGAPMVLAQPPANQLPVQKPGGAIINATIGPATGNTMAITQTASANNRGLIEWSSFSIGSNARVNIAQPNAQSVLVNRVVGNGNASEIYGAMSANGHVYLINPSGVIFGPRAQVNVGSLVATSLDMANASTANNYAGYLNGSPVQLTQTQSGGNGASVQVMPSADGNTPQIVVGEGGSIVLVSRDQVVQNGTVSAPKGSITLSSASAASLVPVGTSGFVDLLVTAPSSAGGVSLGRGSQTLASDGRIVIGAQANEQGTRSDTLAIAGRVSADSSTGNAGSVRIDAGANGSVSLTDGAVVSASSTAANGGQINLLGGSIAIKPGQAAQPQVLADGARGGGGVVIGNTATRAILIDSNTLVSADATQTGNGGNIAVKAMYSNLPVNTSQAVARTDYGVAEVYGTLRARGGVVTGNGGLIETSGVALNTRLTDAITGATKKAWVDASARAPGGVAGTWLLDPFDVTISNGVTTGVDGSFNPNAAGANVNAGDISAALNAGTSVDISTAGGSPSVAGDITIAADTNITRSAGAAPTSLTLHANGNIVASGAVIDATAAGPLNVSLLSDLDGNGVGFINLNGTRIATAGGNLTLSGGTNPGTGFARGDVQNSAITLQGATIDTTGTRVPGVGNVIIRGQAGAGSPTVGVDLGGTLTVGNLSVLGLSDLGTGVTLNGSNITTAAGNIDVRGVSVRSSNATASIVGVDTGTAAISLGTGSLTLAGSGDDNAKVPFGGATGLRIGDLRISAAATTAGRVTLVGQATGGSFGTGLANNFGNSGLIISSDATQPNAAATGANIVFGGLSDNGQALNLSNGQVPNIATSGTVNYRPLGVAADGSITEQTATAIRVAPSAAAASSPGFNVDTAWLRAPVAGRSNGTLAGQGFVIGSAAHTGAITVDNNAFTQHPNVIVTLQNEGAGSNGISVGSGNTVGTLGLLSAGSVTQGVGGIIAQNLVIRGNAGTTVTLDQANQIGVLAFDPPGNLKVVTQGNLTVDAATAPSFDATAGFAPLAITNSTGGTTGLLQSTAGNVLINRSIAMAGPGTQQLDIVAAAGSVTFANGATPSATSGRWQVWAPTVVGAPNTGPAQNLYGCPYAAGSTTCSTSGIAIPATGNHVLHPNQPTLTVAANPASGFSGAAPPTFTYSVANLANGDTAAGAVSGAPATTATTNSPPGTYQITQGTVVSPLGYLVTFTPAAFTLSQAPSLDQLGIAREMLQSRFAQEMSSDVYGRNLAQPYICTAASVLRDTLADSTQTDPLASEWGKVRNQPQLSGCLNVTDAGQCSAF